jgi:hypothetical protein
MPSKRSRIFIILITLISLSLACSLTGTPEERPENPPDLPLDGDTIATAVAATLAAVQAGDGENPPPTTHPTVTAGVSSALEVNSNCAGVSFYFSDLLADDFTAGIIPGEYDANNTWWSTPEHRECVFNNWVLADGFHTPAIRVYSVADYQAINENVSDGLDGLLTAFDSQPADHAGLVVPDLYNAGQLFQAQVKYLDFQNGHGARWLSQYGQAYYVIGWPHLFYTFQGFTDDGLYYISIRFPVTHPSLPQNPEAITLDDIFYDNYAAYAEETRVELNAGADNSFAPSLVLLDQLVESMLVGGMP